VSAASSRGGTHGTCQNCHGAHGFPRPSCTSCHADIKRRDAHAMKDHQTCGSCHDAHRKATVTRKQCLACHTDMTDHQPGAQRCQSCHPF
jgi:hypothetical protein